MSDITLESLMLCIYLNRALQHNIEYGVLDQFQATARVQDVLIRMKDSVVGAIKPDFFEKTTDNADL